MSASRRLFYDNTASLKDNVASNLALYLARRSSDVSHNYSLLEFPSPAVKNLGSQINERAIREFKDFYSEMLENEEVYGSQYFNGKLLRKTVTSTRIQENSDRTINTLERHQDLVPESLRREVRKYYGSNFRITDLAAYRHYHHPEDWKHESRGLNSLFQWHIDPYYTSLKIFIPLDDFSQEKGATRYLTEEDTQRIETPSRKGYSGNPEELEKDYSVKTLEAKKGDAILFNPQKVLHRAGSLPEGNPETYSFSRQYLFTPRCRMTGQAHHSIGQINLYSAPGSGSWHTSKKALPVK